jgi:hypothetical protein
MANIERAMRQLSPCRRRKSADRENKKISVWSKPVRQRLLCPRLGNSKFALMLELNL